MTSPTASPTPSSAASSPAFLAAGRVPRAWRRRALVGVSLALTLGTVACTSSTDSTAGSAAGSAVGDDGAGSAASAQPYPSHVHGLAVDPDTQSVLIASHEGLFTVNGESAEPMGQTIDLMGFTVGSDGTYFASGHPGPGVDLPNPVGLISSTDGLTWSQVARGGESDFHTLTTTYQGIIGFDGTLRVSKDGSSWTDATTQISPYTLAGNPATELAVATTEDGIYRSEDAGKTWTKEPDAPVVLVAAVTDGSDLIGVLPAGDVLTSTDAGITWEQAGKVSAQPSAVTTKRTTNGMEVWVTTENGLEKSVDNGMTFTTVIDAGGA
ncbi:F510_1955 family glycosylhydrolase [Arthrobacter sp. TmT3-37]|uniref:F510_1955 family glycosylhydrolase n=1 Tax=Arthrobacter sp. B1805 TaxID=2058892 RepID=UPI0011B07002|nr:exo-alpha-sialidase [Arthrobacter sp. B1805]